MNGESTNKQTVKSQEATPAVRKTTLDVGHAGEMLAANYLKSQGYQILHLNWRCRKGEIDIVAQEGATIVFVEVKLRGRTSHGSPNEAVHLRKQRCITNAAALYAVQNELEDRAMRFDVVEVLQDHSNDASSFRLWRDAFTPGGSYVAL